MLPLLHEEELKYETTDIHLLTQGAGMGRGNASNTFKGVFPLPEIEDGKMHH